MKYNSGEFVLTCCSHYCLTVCMREEFYNKLGMNLKRRMMMIQSDWKDKTKLTIVIYLYK